MVGWTRRNREASERRAKWERENPCPCAQTCRCHQPHKEGIVFPILAMMFAFGMIGTCGYLTHGGDGRKTPIEVDGKMCVIDWKQEGISSTGASYGHSIANCDGGK